MLTACNPFFRKSKEMEQALEQVMAVYGDGNLEIEVDTVLFVPGLSEAPAFFAGKKQYDKAALAALLNGYTEKDFDKEAAMLSFKDAEHYGELAQDSLTMARAEYWMGKFLYEEGRIEEALSMLKTSFKYIGKRPMDKAIIENSLAVSFLLLHQSDSAAFYLQHSLIYAQDCHLDKLERKTLNNLAVLHRIRGEYTLALDCIRIIFAKPYLDNLDKALVYLNFGNTFMAEGSVDSATYYYQYLDTIVSNTQIKNDVKLTVYDALLRFAKNQGNDSLALQYYEKHESALFKVMNQRQEQAVYRIQKQYDYEALQNTMNQKLARNQRIVAIVVVLLLCFLAWILFRSAQASKREARANANLFHFMQQNKDLIESNMAQEEKAVLVEQQLSDRLFARLYAMQKLDYCLKTPNDKIALKDLEREVFGTGDHWEAVKEVLVNLYPGLWESLKLKYPEMDEMELRVCMLSRLKLSRLGEATLLGISTSVLDKLRTKVRKTLEQDKNL
jgi:tetratricopeptide (TPR) repeat protein